MYMQNLSDKIHNLNPQTKEVLIASALLVLSLLYLA